MDTKLINENGEMESYIFFMKMKGDYYRYLCETDSADKDGKLFSRLVFQGLIQGGFLGRGGLPPPPPQKKKLVCDGCGIQYNKLWCGLVVKSP